LASLIEARNKLNFLASCALLAGLAGCPAKEAEDPRSILGEDLDYQGASASGKAPESPRKPDSPRQPPPPRPSGTKLATPAECEAAARHMVELGVELAIREETDPAKKKQLEAQRASASQNQDAKDYIASLTDDCIRDQTTQRKAQCMARVQSQMDIDRCPQQ
jgi:hypothetical protein